MSKRKPTRNRKPGKPSVSGRPSEDYGEPVSSRSARPIILLACAIIAAIGIGLLFKGMQGNLGGQHGANPDNNGSLGGPGEASLANPLEMTRVALAATENLETEAADQSWDALHQLDPSDASVSLNRALNRVLLVDELSSTATNAALDAEEKKAARSRLPDAIAGARDAIDAYSGESQDKVTKMWLHARIDLHEASLLPGSMTKSLRREVYQRLSKAVQGEIGKDPRSMILGGSLLTVLEQMEDPVDGLPKPVLDDAATAVGKLSDNHSDNLFFALRAVRLNIETRNSKAVEYVRRAGELTSAIVPSLAAETKKIGLTPVGLIDEITTAIVSEDWSTAENRNLLWFNVLNSSEIVKTDRRRASPHPLDRLSFDSLRNLSAEAARNDPIGKGNSEIDFASSLLDDSKGFQVFATIDYDLDLAPDLIAADDKGNLRLWQNSENGWAIAGDLKLDIVPKHLTIADLFVVDSSDPERLRSDRTDAVTGKPVSSLRHNTLLHVIAVGDDGVRIVSVDGRSKPDTKGRLKLAERESGLDEVRGVTASVVGDLEADGDLDLVLATKSDGVRIFINRGNRTFFELPKQSQRFAIDDPVSSLAIVDLDRDLDLDIVTTHRQSGHVGLLENLLHLQFRGRVLEEIPAIKDASSIIVEDVDGNVSWDLIVGGRSSASIVFSQTADAGAWVIDRVETSSQDLSPLIAADVDNDSWIEVVSAGLYSRIGPWGWGDWESAKVIDSEHSLLSADFNRDGGIDLIAAGTEGIGVLTNSTKPIGHFVDLRFKGIDDNASGRVNHYAIGSVLEMRFGNHYRARIVTSPSTHFGIDGADRASSVRAILPNGLTQTIRDPKIDALVEEEQTLKGSCPYLYAWDGEKFAFLTDCLWAAPLGLQVARGVVAKDRPWEYLKLDGRNIRPKNGQYELRITEELWEVAYFDEIELSVVDHPTDVEVWTNEKVGPEQLATPTIFAFASEDRRPIANAADTSGDDVTSLLRQADREFVQGFDRRLRQGLCEPHWIDLDFGQIKKSRSDAAVYLVLTGWIMPTDASLNIQIDQNPDLAPIEFPSVWVPDSDERSGWRNAIPFMGFPGGKTKTIVVDVSEVWNVDDPRFRVRTSAQIYWDSAELVVQNEIPEIVTRPAVLLSATIDFHGFSRRIKDGPRQPERYDYADASPASRWPPLRGALSRTGDCIDLVRKWDDSMAVISGGDEIRLRFDASDEAPPAGWTRDFILHSVGWDKDADLNTLTGQQIGPLPFREMSEYPPTIDQTDKSSQVNLLNRKHRTRNQQFRSFWYRGTQPPPMRFGSRPTD